MTDNPHYVTPEEAKKKICLSSMGGLLMVHDAVMVSEHECHGPDCMAWRWDKNAPIRYKGDGNPQPTEQAKGFCGMVRS